MYGTQGEYLIRDGVVVCDIYSLVNFKSAIPYNW